MQQITPERVLDELGVQDGLEIVRNLIILQRTLINVEKLINQNMKQAGVQVKMLIIYLEST